MRKLDKLSAIYPPIFSIRINPSIILEIFYLIVPELGLDKVAIVDLRRSKQSSSNVF